MTKLTKPIRFIHASDFHLEEPIQGLAQVPSHLRDVLIDAPFKAAARVFEVATREEVDFVLLAGDILQPSQAGPRAVQFLRECFDHLREYGIAIYWIPGKADRAQTWPVSVPFPECVHRCTSRHVESMTHYRDDEPVAVIRCSGRPSKRPFNAQEYNSRREGPVQIGLAYGSAPHEELEATEIDYWALGGKHESAVLCNSGSFAQYCGSPQARRPSEQGEHGCYLVQIEQVGHIERQFEPTDVVRWKCERLELEPDMSEEDLASSLSARTQELLDSTSGRQLLVNWIISHNDSLTNVESNELAARIRRGKLAQHLLDGLRREFGMETPGIWSADLDVQPPSTLPSEWYEQDTVLGDLLRLVRHYQQNDDEPLVELQSYLEQEDVTPEIAELMQIKDAGQRQNLLQRVAVLGMDLLGSAREISGD